MISNLAKRNEIPGREQDQNLKVNLCFIIKKEDADCTQGGKKHLIGVLCSYKGNFIQLFYSVVAVKCELDVKNS